MFELSLALYLDTLPAIDPDPMPEPDFEPGISPEPDPTIPPVSPDPGIDPGFPADPFVSPTPLVARTQLLQ